MCKVCDPLKSDSNGKIYHLQQPTCKAETQICDQCDLRYIGENHECLSELKDFSRVTRENEFKKIEFLSFYDTFGKCKGCKKL